MRLSVIIPIYNEEQRLPDTLKAIHGYLKKQSYEYEIIAVNDGSKDRTESILKKFLITVPYLRVIKIEHRGKGSAIKQGMLNAKGKILLFCDADNSTSIDQVEKMFPWFSQGYEVVIGSRDIKGAVLAPPQPWFRNLVSGESFKLLRKILVGLWDIEDSQCGFKAFSKKAAKEVFPQSIIEQFAFDPEVLYLARRLGYRIKEIPVTWANDIHSKVTMQSVIKMGIDLFLIRMRIWVGAY
ncbi:MAG: glycosyltransferase family 2 protein [Candidatus Wildermuthbacteria bacterium]|nr:glycosyltransferase family 2 protein [Candidatus Wildermuthbacteria bacterium]